MYPIKKFSCVIVDDEVYCSEILKEYIGTMPHLELTHTYNDSVTAVKEIAQSKTTIDFLFMDIKMPKLSGLEVAAAIRHKVDKLVFTTAHAKHSLAAYDVLCNQYLLKPFTQLRFKEAVHKLIDHEIKEIEAPTGNIFIKAGSNNKYLQIKSDDIIFINAMEHYVVIHTLTDQHIQHSSMREIEQALRGTNNFIRVHKSHIVAKKHILSVHGNIILLTNNLEIAIGATFKQSFNNYLNRNSLS